MKTTLSKPSREQGSVLLITLTLGVILALASVSYLLLVGNQKSTVVRSQTWNAAITMAEAGVEDALAQINNSPGDFSANSWPKSGNSYGPVSRTLIGGNYKVRLEGSTNPIIYSTGYTTVPITGGLIKRAVKVTTRQVQSVFNVAFAAINNIDFNGNGVASDSWNSRTNAWSTNGKYDPNKTRAHGNMASVQGLVNIGNHTVMGDLYLGPTATYNGGGTISGTIYKDFNVNFPDVTLPAGANGWTIAVPTSTTTFSTNVTQNITSSKSQGVTTYTTNYVTTITSSSATKYYFTSSGNYILQNNLYPIEVQPNVTVTLNVTATAFDPPSLKLNNGGNIDNSGTAIIYLNGPTSATIHGNDSVNDNRPANLYYYGLPSLTSLTFSGTTSFVGVIYAPEVTLTLNGGGNNIGVIGSLIVKSIQMNGHYDFHYDESLASLGATRGFIATSWQEL